MAGTLLLCVWDLLSAVTTSIATSFQPLDDLRALLELLGLSGSPGKRAFAQSMFPRSRVVGPFYQLNAPMRRL